MNIGKGTYMYLRSNEIMFHLLILNGFKYVVRWWYSFEGNPKVFSKRPPMLFKYQIEYIMIRVLASTTAFLSRSLRLPVLCGIHSRVSAFERLFAAYIIKDSPVELVTMIDCSCRYGCIPNLKFSDTCFLVSGCHRLSRHRCFPTVACLLLFIVH